MNSVYDIIIIGAGASGLMSACLLASFAGKNNDSGNARILILEKEDRVGRKLSATGNGRCNLTNMIMDWKHYYGDKDWIKTVLDEVSPDTVIRTFADLGVLTREKDGYVYPHSNQAATVIGALYRGIRRPGIQLELSSRVRQVYSEDTYGNRCISGYDNADVYTDDNHNDEYKSIEVDPDTGDVLWAPTRFLVKTDEKTYGCDKLIVATGGPAGAEQGGCDDGYALLQSLGHTVNPALPGLTGMNAAGRFWKEVAGTRLQGSFTLFVDGMRQGTETGEIQITKTGVSGIPVFQLCRVAAEAIAKDKSVWGEIDFVPSLTGEECVRWIELNGIEGLVPVKWFPVLGRGQKNAVTLAKTLKHFEFTITETYDIEKAQVSAGGVPVNEIDPKTFQSRICPGLYVLGELADIDGMCGGYNLHLAWSSAILAARNIQTPHNL
ncbi:MAG: NAD(P)/FAD-dependent oxidoreductase [Eubacterium sp.]|nr:NAD(P)/FAD-dependent oxidoreductase [Eubacterium sp.]